MPIEQHRAPTFYTVPAGTVVARCRSNQCQADIYFVPSIKTPGKKVPIDCSVVGGRAPTELESGLGIIHHIVCEDAERFRDRRPPARRPGQHQRELAVDHKPAACIFCGCTQEKACRVSVEESGLVALLDDMVAPDGMVGCSWLQLEPVPVCSAPACREQYKDLPLRMRMKPRTERLRRAK